MAEHTDVGGATGFVAAALAFVGALGAAWRGKTLGERVEMIDARVGELDVRVGAAVASAQERRSTADRFEDRTEALFDKVFEKLDELKAELAALRASHNGHRRPGS